MKVLKFPLAKISIGFAMGIGVAHYVKPQLYSVLLVLSFLLLLLFFLFFLSKKIKALHSMFGVTAILLAVVAGAADLCFQNQTLYKDHYIHFIQNKNHHKLLSLTLQEQIKSSAKNIRYIVQLHQIDQNKCTGKAILNIAKSNTLLRWSNGQNLLAIASIYKNSTPANPNQFDYKAYLENQQIYAQIYTHPNNLIATTTVDKNMGYYASKLRNRILRNLEQHHFNQKELSIVMALLLGQQQEIDPELVQEYQYAGAIHLLSVSGLHVACILFFIQLLLKPIPNHRKGSFIKLVIILLFLWSFGFLAGMAPSVLRSVTMFSFISVGLYLRRTVNFYHTLLVSLFLILIVTPSFLFDIGLQLSYLAVFFIVWLQPLFAGMQSPKNRIRRYFWELLTISIAAQLGTLPLSLYYFHQFPGLFFVTNLLLLPFLTIVLGLALMVVSLAALNWVPYYPMAALEWCIKGMNTIISEVASFESFILKDIPFNSSLLIGSYILITAWVVWAKKPNFKKIRFALASIALFQVLLLYTIIENKQKKEWIVYDVKGNTLISELKNGRITMYSNQQADKNKINLRLLQPYRIAHFCSDQKEGQLSNLYYFKNKKILLIDRRGHYLTHEKADILILTQSSPLNIERLLSYWKPQQIVVDGSNSSSCKKRWRATALKEKIPFHDTSEKGYYKL